MPNKSSEYAARFDNRLEMWHAVLPKFNSRETFGVIFRYKAKTPNNMLQYIVFTEEHC